MDRLKLKSILLVEDQELDVELTLEAFKENRLANEVQVLRDGEEALDYLFLQGRFADREPGLPILILLDIKMPKVDGLEVLRRIKGDPVLKLIPVVMLTTSKEEQDLMESYQLGVNAYVIKPVHFPDFVAAIRQLGAFWALVNVPPPGAQRLPPAEGR
jgi:CheY-like chemotaxis protein